MAGFRLLVLCDEVSIIWSEECSPARGTSPAWGRSSLGGPIRWIGLGKLPDFNVIHVCDQRDSFG
jgi:hypothetical protein